MSRSIRKTPIFGITRAASEKKDKKIWHSRFRHASKQKLRACDDLDTMVDVAAKEVSNPWLMSKDGKRRVSDIRHPKLKEWLRK
jgi:hypothetical protein